MHHNVRSLHVECYLTTFLILSQEHISTVCIPQQSTVTTVTKLGLKRTLVYAHFGSQLSNWIITKQQRARAEFSIHLIYFASVTVSIQLSASPSTQCSDCNPSSNFVNWNLWTLQFMVSAVVHIHRQLCNNADLTWHIIHHLSNTSFHVMKFTSNDNKTRNNQQKIHKKLILKW